MNRVCILLATYNGARWLDEQLDSLFAQQHVDLRVVASDDQSRDDTLAVLAITGAQVGSATLDSLSRHWHTYWGQVRSAATFPAAIIRGPSPLSHAATPPHPFYCQPWSGAADPATARRSAGARR